MKKRFELNDWNTNDENENLLMRYIKLEKVKYY